MKAHLKLLPLFFLFIISFSACRKDNSPQRGGDVVVRLAKDPERLHPVIFPNPTAREVYQYIFAPIADYDPVTLELTPILIKEIPELKEEADGRISYTLEFREEAVWEDGSPVTAADYLFTLKAVMHPNTQASANRSFISNISDVVLDPSDARKMTIYYDEYYMLAKETAIYLEVYPEKIYDPNAALKNVKYTDFKNPEKINELVSRDSTFVKFAEDFNSAEFSREVISGAGPYKLAYWEANQSIVLERKENYWGDKLGINFIKSYPDRIIFQIIPDETAAVLELKRGGVDVIMNLGAEAFEQLKADTATINEFSLYTPQLIRYYFILINNQHPAMKSKLSRRALAHMVDVDDFIQRLEFGYGLRTPGPVNPAKPEYNDQLKLIDYNLEKAKKILTQDGWSDSDGNGIIDKMVDGNLINFELDMYITGSELGKVIASQLEQNAAKCGIKINVNVKDFGLTRTENLNTGDFALIPNVASQDLGLDDPYQRFHSDNARPGGTNNSFYVSTKADSLIQLIRSERNDAKRIKAFKEFQKVIYEDQPYIFLYVPMGRLVVNKKWTGFGTPKRPGYMVNNFVLNPALVKSNPN